jgi:hypothetical protein
MKRTPIRKKKPSVAAAQCLQRRALVIRSASRCEMEYRVEGGKWVRCRNAATDPAHVYTRPKCGAARDLLDAVIHACRPCHDRSKGRLATESTRVPLRCAQRAWDVILAHSRLGTDAEDRLRIHIGSVGPRPEKGTPPYES